VKALCLFGGSFDPAHIGHLLVARAALEELPVERVIFVPAAQSPFKPHLPPAPTEVRLQMLRASLAGRPWAEVDTQEIERGGVSYTVETLRRYKARFPGARLHYLIGQDNIAQLPEWRCSAELAQLADFVVIPRPDSPSGGGADGLSGQAPASFRVRYLKGFPLGVSSSQIRARVGAGLCIEDFVAPGVGEIIRNNRLYTGPR
jgi:nicotinate-nucleotide adenylyltransferase